MKTLISLSSCIILAFSFGSFAYADTLTLRVETTSDSGTLRAAVYDSQAFFEAGKSVAETEGPVANGANSLTIEGLKPGTYGIALYHDVNGNEELDTNLFGAPNEPFGFSQNPKIGFSAPKFDAFKFEFDGAPQKFNIILNGG